MPWEHKLIVQLPLFEAVFDWYVQGISDQAPTVMSEKISGGMRREYHSRDKGAASPLISNLHWLHTDYTEVLPASHQEYYNNLEPHQ